MADYLESYARQFELPVRGGRRVEQVARFDGHFAVTAGDECYTADNVVVAMSGWQQPRVPAFASELAPEIVQLHSSDYRNPRAAARWSGPDCWRRELRSGDCDGRGAGRPSRDRCRAERWGKCHFRSMRSPCARSFRCCSGCFSIVWPPRTLPLGRRMRRIWEHGTPLIRTRESDLAAAGVERAPRVDRRAQWIADARG